MTKTLQKRHENVLKSLKNISSVHLCRSNENKVEGHNYHIFCNCKKLTQISRISCWLVLCHWPNLSRFWISISTNFNIILTKYNFLRYIIWMHKTLKLIFACNEQYSLGVLSFHMHMYISGNLNVTFYFRAKFD